jgi:hypothetical protein
MHYRYARVRVYDNNTGAIVYDSNKIHSNQVISFFFSATNPLNSGYILMEVYGAPLSIQDMSLHYYNENILTPLNNYGMGIRIKSISNYNFDSVLISKKIYEYSKSENPLISSGVLIKDVQSNYQSNPTVHALASCCDLQVCDPYTGCHQVEFGCDWKNFTTTSYMSNSITGVEGNSVIYSEVKVKEISNIDNSSNGFTKYFFTTDADFLFDSKGIVKVDFGYRRGKLLVKEIYRESNFPNNVPVLLNKIVNKYVDDDRRVSHIKGFILFQHIYVDSPPVNNTLPFDIGTILEPVTYDIPVNWFYQIESESTDYFYDMTDTFSKAITNKTRFIYNNPLHLQLSSQVTEGSTGEALETKYFYPQDSQMNGEAYVNDLIIKNMNGIPLLSLIHISEPTRPCH